MSITPPPTQKIQKYASTPVTKDADTIAESQQDSFRVDTPTDARQKRKRTSPHDHAILEAAYQKNSKPDKQERLKLVEKVDLGEKEVQIWFQNRRQNDRRKSKPLQPHELIPHFRNGIPIEAAKQLPSPKASQSVATEALNQMLPSSDTKSGHTSPRPHDIHSLLNETDEPNTSSPIAPQQQTPATGGGGLVTPPSSLERRAPPETAITYTSPLAPPSSAPHMTKKRSHEQMNDGQIVAVVDEDLPKDAKTLRRTSSFVRLAVSADGSVKIRTDNEPTPSPPKERPQPPPHTTNRRASGFSRAQSDLNFRDAHTMRGALGRSRDARTWEFYCDRSNRSLAARAEDEATGSAVGALGLMRSAIQRRTQPLTPNLVKQNGFRRTPSSLKSTPVLVRTHSSMARLQSSSSVVGECPKTSRPDLHRRSSGSDSDKENWIPGTRDAVNEQRETEASNTSVSAVEERCEHEVRRGGGPNQRSVKARESRTAPTNGKAKVDDLDCVQGLLSLSQGAWR